MTTVAVSQPCGSRHSRCDLFRRSLKIQLHKHILMDIHQRKSTRCYDSCRGLFQPQLFSLRVLLCRAHMGRRPLALLHRASKPHRSTNRAAHGEPADELKLTKKGWQRRFRKMTNTAGADTLDLQW